MIDFLAGLFFASLAVRGWLRGFVREGMDLVGLILGIALAFRLASPVEALFADTLGTSPEVSQLLGGFAVFLGVGIAASIVAHYLQRLVGLPGLNLPNRLGGSALALAWGVFIATLVFSLLMVVPAPRSVEAAVEGSTVAHSLTRPGSPSRSLFQAVAGDRIIEALLNLRELVGGRRVVVEEGERITFAPADPAQLRVDAEAARRVFELLNRARVEAGLEPLAWSDALARVAEAHAMEMYTMGYFAHRSPVTGGPADRVEAAGIPYLVVGENLALATSPEAAHEGLMESPGHRENILRPQFRRVGIAAVEGPLGLMVVQVFTG